MVCLTAVAQFVPVPAAVATRPRNGMRASASVRVSRVRAEQHCVDDLNACNLASLHNPSAVVCVQGAALIPAAIAAPGRLTEQAPKGETCNIPSSIYPIRCTIQSSHAKAGLEFECHLKGSLAPCRCRGGAAQVASPHLTGSGQVLGGGSLATHGTRGCHPAAPSQTAPLPLSPPPPLFLIAVRARHRRLHRRPAPFQRQSRRPPRRLLGGQAPPRHG